jgi:translation elongation factor P/translation initiation factor 5A
MKNAAIKNLLDIRCCFALLLTSALMVLPFRLQATGDVNKKAQLTAAFIYQITKFTKWPAALFGSSNPSFSICVLGKKETQLYQFLGALETKMAQGHAIEVIQIQNKQQLFNRSGNNCEVLYSTYQEWQVLSNEEIAQLTQTTLLIGSSKKFLKHGGMLALVTVNNKMKIYINPKNIVNTPIKLESRLKALAKSI